MGYPKQERGVLCVEAQPADLLLQGDEIPLDQVSQDPVPCVVGYAVGSEQLGVERGVAQPDAIVLQAGGVQRRAEQAEDLSGAFWGSRPEQLRPGLQKFS